MDKNETEAIRVA